MLLWRFDRGQPPASPYIMPDHPGPDTGPGHGGRGAAGAGQHRGGAAQDVYQNSSVMMFAEKPPNLMSTYTLAWCLDRF